ncbi:hypothetical protein ABZ403_04080 [Micromonospora zamorensis]|uniref:hypothetical protein n=1 Tax=Micromonospora zamorensis TaxID=709883 RepID=UPI00340FB6F0
MATIAEATVRPIRYVQLTPEQYRAELLAEPADGRRQPARGHDCGRRWSELRAV